MKSYLSVLLILSLAVFGQAQNNDFPSYEDYLDMFDKQYFGDEATASRNNYEAHILIMQGITDFTPEVNQLTDLSDADIEKIKGTKVKGSDDSVESSKVSGKLGAPTQMDWRDQDIISEVKDQGVCGNGWGFAPVAYTEAKLRMEGNSNALVSDQYVLECTGSNSCNGGYLEDGMNRVIEGSTPENWYPYFYFTTYPDICDTTDGLLSAGKPLESYYDITDDEIITLLQESPLVISVAAQNWEYYGEGVLSCSATAQVNHAVLLVGYTEEYWIAKNSWGKNWGEDGYIRILRDENRDCKIGTSVHKTFEWNIQTVFLGLALCLALLLL